LAQSVKRSKYWK